MQQGAVIILIFLWVLAIIVILAVLKGYDDSDHANATSVHAHAPYSMPSSQTPLLCLSE